MMISLRHITIIALTVLLFGKTYGQDTAKSNLTKDFILDSIGTLNLRAKHITFSEDSNGYEDLLFDGKSLKGLTKDSVLALLGKPNWISSRKKFLYIRPAYQSFNYFAFFNIPECNDRGDKRSWALINFVEGKVYSTTVRFYCNTWQKVKMK